MGQAENVEFAVSAYESALNLQIWKSYADEMAVLLIHPGGMQIGPIRQIQGPQRFTLGQTQILLYYGEPSPYSPYQEIYLDFLPVRDYVDSGIWTVRLIPQRIVTGRYDMWFPAGGVLNEGTGFLLPREETTLTIPSTAAKVITVGAYDARFGQDFQAEDLPETDRSSRILRRRAWRSPPARRAEAIRRVPELRWQPRL